MRRQRVAPSGAGGSGAGGLGIRSLRRYGPSNRNSDMGRTSLAMADHAVPHFQNDPGVPVIEIGAKEFMCVGATPPFDHPHIFCDMGDENEIICSYCSTLFRFDPKLGPHDARPPECALHDAAGVTAPASP
jgi:uncharacterized Zn-finger protein